jgi:hypothetical protein
MGAKEVAGPVDIVLLAFPGSKFKGEIAPAIGKLVDAGTIRLIDAVVVKKEENGDVISIELSDLGDDAGPFSGLDIGIGELVSDEDVALAAEALEPNSTAALLVFENTWMAEVAAAIRNADGIVVMQDRIPAAVVQAALDDLDANPA